MTHNISLHKVSSYRELTTLYIILIIAFLFWPLLGITFSVCWALSSNKKERVWPFMLLLAIYLCSINSTKTPESDMVGYLEMFSKAEENGLENTIKFWDNDRLKEIVYGTFVYLSYFFLGGNERLFIAVITFLTYFFIFKAIYLMDNKKENNNYLIVASAISIAFFTQYFSLTAHLIRQVLATSIFMYAISLRINGQRTHWLWLAVAFSVHNAVGILLALSMIPYIKRKPNVFTILILSTLIFLFTTYFTKIAGVLENMIDSYALQRAANAEGASDGLEMDVMAAYIIFIPLGFISIINSFKKRPEIPPIFSNLAIMLILLVVGLSFSPLLQYRFFFFAYSFIPFIIPFLFKSGTIYSKLYCIAFSSLFIIRFFYTFEDITFEYAPLDLVIISPYWELLQIQ